MNKKYPDILYIKQPEAKIHFRKYKLYFNEYHISLATFIYSMF